MSPIPHILFYIYFMITLPFPFIYFYICYIFSILILAYISSFLEFLWW